MSSESSFRVDALARRLDGELVGDGAVEVRGLASLADAGPDDLSLFADPRYRGELARTRAAALVTKERIQEAGIPQIVVSDPFLALIDLVELFYPDTFPEPGVDPRAQVSSSATIAASASVLPFASIDDEVEIGDRTVIHPGVYVGKGVRIGESSVLWPNVVVREGCRIGNRVVLQPGAVIGSDGFGFARREGRFVKVRHVGTVVIEDDVEIGANTAIDRGTLGQTIIHRGVKIDNLVHIAHNVEVGEDSAMAAQVGISGSTVIGKRVLMGGQAGLVDHLTVGDDAMLVAQSGAIGNIPSGTMVSGFPARPHREFLKATAAVRGLERLRKQIRALEQELEGLKKKSQ